MIELNIESPTTCYIENPSTDEISRLKRHLTYSDTSAAFNLKSLNQNRWLQTNKPQTFLLRKQELEAKLKVCMLKFSSENQKYWFHPGSIAYLNELFSFSYVSDVCLIRFSNIVIAFSNVIFSNLLVKFAKRVFVLSGFDSQIKNPLRDLIA